MLDSQSNSDGSSSIDKKEGVVSKILQQRAHSVDRNDYILSLFNLCEEYLECQNQMDELLRNGYFQLAMARKASSGITSLADCRHEICASITLETSNKNSTINLSNGEKTSSEPIDEAVDMLRLNHLTIQTVSTNKVENDNHSSIPIFGMNHDKSNDSAYLFSGMPHRALRKAQSNFKEVIECAVLQANIKNKLIILLHQQSTE